MIKVLCITVLPILLGFVTPFSFAQTATDGGNQGILERVSPAPLPEMKCGACTESYSTKTEDKAIQTQLPTPSGADVKGVQNTPVPTPKTTIKPIIKPVLSPSPLSSPSSFIAASPSTQPTLEPAEQEQTSTIIKIWGWIIGLFSS